VLGECNEVSSSLSAMSKQPGRAPGPDDWPDEEGGGEAQKSLRSDIGASLERPRAEDTPDADRTEPTGQRGPAGSGLVPGRGNLGTPTSTEKGAEQGPR
jgi:hypothetical protein